MTTAQDQAILTLASRSGLLSSELLARAKVLLREANEEGAPLAHLLLREGILSSTEVAGLLRDLARGTFVCVHCAERLPYFLLARLAGLVCPRCGAELAHAPHPARSTETTTRGSTRRTPWGQWDDPGSRATVTFATAEQLGLSELSWSPPRHLGRYQLLSPLGKGSSGIVYRARRMESRDECAVKLLRPGLLDSETVARFWVEATVASQLKHPGIIPVLDIGSEAGICFYAMELCRGPTLRDLLREGPLGVETACDWVRSVSRAAHAAHEHGVVHRDLKPGNILLEDGRRPRITDFGLAREIDGENSLTRTGDLLGTPCYMAPEQLCAEAVDARTDVYALGVTLYECLTGRRPYNAPTVLGLAEKILKYEPPPPSRWVEVPEGLDAICMRAMAKSPAARFQSAQALAEQLG